VFNTRRFHQGGICPTARSWPFGPRCTKNLQIGRRRGHKNTIRRLSTGHLRPRANWRNERFMTGRRLLHKTTLTNKQRRILSHPRGLIPSQFSAAPRANLERTNDLLATHEAKTGANKASLKKEKIFPRPFSHRRQKLPPAGSSVCREALFGSR